MRPAFTVDFAPGKVVLTGEIDLDAADELGRAIDAALDQQPDRSVSVDMSQVTFLDSSALRELLVPSQRGATLCVIEPSDPVRRVITITGLVDVLLGE